MEGDNMIRHVFTTKCKEGTTDQEVDNFVNAMNAMKGTIPGMIDLHVGRNLEWYDHKAQIVVIADLEDKEAWDTYMTFPQHLKNGEKYGYIFDEDTMIASQLEY